MRKYFAVFMVAFTIASCTNDIDTIAEKQLKKTIAGFYDGKKSNYEIQSIEHFFSNDSICIIRFSFLDRYQDDKPHRSEYVYLSQKDGDRELLLDLEVQQSVEGSARELSSKYDLPIEKELASAAYMMTLFAGRKVKE